MRLVLAGILVLSIGCKSKQEKYVDGLVSDADEKLPQIKAAIASGKLDRESIPCVSITANIREIEKTHDHDELVTEIKQVCDHDVHVARMRRAAGVAEAARKARPDDQVMAECFSGELSTAIHFLQEEKRFDAAAQAELERFIAACPRQADDLREEMSP